MTFGATQHDIPLAAVAAVAAVLVVTGAGTAVRAPLAWVPENTVKFLVGVVLSFFGIFWGGGAGARWPGPDLALLAVIPAVALFALTPVAVLAGSPPDHW